jgi:hypothetical protein
VHIAQPQSIHLILSNKYTCSSQEGEVEGGR